MSLDTPKSGFASAAEFQSSALPYVTSSQAPIFSSGALQINFPKVTRFITVSNGAAAGSRLRVGFTRNGLTNGNYFLVDGGQVVTFELRIKSLFVAGDTTSPVMSLMAGLTNVDQNFMPTLTGTLGDGSPGWLGVG